MAKRMNVSREFVQRWRWRWGRNKEVLSKLEVEEENRAYFEGVLKILSDEPRAGHPLKFTAEQVCQIMAIACEKPQDSGHILSHWGTQQLALEVMKRGIVESISKTQVGRFLKSERY
jgi:transposase